MGTSTPGLLAALFLPWIAGAFWLRLLLPHRLPDGGWPIVLGYGYLAGMMLLSMFVLIIDGLKSVIAFWPVALTLAVAGTLAAALLWLRDRGSAPLSDDSNGAHVSIRKGAPRWKTGIAAILLMLIAIRLLVLTIEVIWQPLYPWDAWWSWSQVARHWFELGELGDIAPARHPRTIPVFQAWTALGWGQWHDTVINLPWVLAGIALLLGLYGQLRRIGSPPVHALLAVYLVASLPILDNHIALAGYADLWLALAFCLGLAALANAMTLRERWQWPLAVVALLLPLTMKVTGLLYLLPLGAVLLLYLLPRRIGLTLIAAVVLAAVAIYLNGGIDIRLGPLGRLALTAQHYELPLVGTGGFRPGQAHGLKAYTPVGPAFVQSLFVLANWHLLWWFALLLPLGLVHGALRRSPYTILVMTLASVIAVFWVAYGFTDHGGAQDYTSINRMLMGVAPIISFTLFWGLARWRHDLGKGER